MDGHPAKLGVLVTAAGAIWLAGCSSDRPGSPPVPENEYPWQAGAIVCDGLASCCQSLGFAFDNAACRDRWALEITPSEGAVSYHASAAAGCLAVLRSNIAACKTPVPSRIDACTRVYSGNEPAGATCTYDRECAGAAPPGGAAYCVSPESVTSDGGTSYGSSVCVAVQPPVRGVIGQSCAKTCTTEGASDVCDDFVYRLGGDPARLAANVVCYTNDGLYCSSSHSCQGLADIGGACDGRSGCVSTAYCDSSSQICQARVEVGAPCSDTDGCVDTAFCDGICREKWADGLPCAGLFVCQGYCSGALTCASGTGVLVNEFTCSFAYGPD